MRLSDSQYGEVHGRERVQRLPQLAHLDRALGLKRRHLPERVDAGVGTSRRVHARRMAEHGRERRLQHPLQGAGVRLQLPAVVVGAVVLEQQSVLHG